MFPFGFRGFKLKALYAKVYVCYPLVFQYPVLMHPDKYTHSLSHSLTHSLCSLPSVASVTAVVFIHSSPHHNITPNLSSVAPSGGLY